MSAPYPSYASVAHPDALYGASPADAVKRFINRYADFRGHASRSEYWWVQLALFLAGMVFGFILSIAGVGMGATGANADSAGPVGLLLGLVFFLFMLALIVPSLALSWRRLHDAGMSGLFYLLSLVPFVGGIIVLILMLMPTKGHNNSHKWG